MNPAPEYTTIKVTKETVEKLKRWKDQHDLPSMDALLKSFVMAGEEQEVPVSASADEGEDSRSPPKRRRIYVRDAL